MNSRIIIILCSVLAIAGCKAHKQVIVDRKPVTQPQAGTAPVARVNAKLVAIRGRQVAFNTFSGKAKAKLDIDGDDNDVTLNIRIERDKRIWVSVTAILGLEVGRTLITPDTIIVLNKLQGVYLKKPFSYVYQYGGKQVSFKTLQALLIGNAMPELLNDNTDISADNANTIVSGRLQDLMYKLIIGADYKVSQSNLSNPLAALTLQVTNSDFIQATNRVIPSQINIITSAAAKKVNINLHYISAEFDKVLEYPFNIPGSYTAVD